MAVDKLVDSTQLDSDLTSVANAIRTKGGTSADLAFPAGFVSAIGAIPTGGTEVPFNDVNFYDYDGTIVYSYTKSEFLALESMPNNPTHTGLTSQGWNWTLSDAKAHVTKYGECDIGQMYVPSDGKTKVVIDIPYSDGMNFQLCWNQSKANGVGIDWGDGSQRETMASTGNKTLAHTYASGGKYTITIDSDQDCTLKLTNGVLVGSGGKHPATVVYDVYIGANVSEIGGLLYSNSFSTIHGITLPTPCPILGTSFVRQSNIAHVTIPSGVTALGNYALMNCGNLRSISLPKSFVTLACFGWCYLLKRLVLSDNVTNLVVASGLLNSDNLMDHFTIPDSVTSMDGTVIDSCYKIKKITIPSSVTVIGTKALNSLQCDVYMEATTPPTLSNVNGMGISGDIYVPYSADHSVRDAYLTATNWSDLSSKIKEMPAS